MALEVQLTAWLNRAFDGHDNLRASLKPVVDEIAALLGLDDGDPRVRWCYAQGLTEDTPCISVTVRALQKNRVKKV